MQHFDVIIIGGGAVGCAIAYTLGKQNLHIALLEKNPDVAMGTSGKNSAVVHAGFNNKPGTLMAKYCVEGNKRFEAICALLDVPYKKTGKLVVGFNDDDIAIINNLIADGEKNDCIGLSLIDKTAMADLEPEVAGIYALYSANTAIFDPFLYTINLCEAAIQNGTSFFMNNEVTSIRKESGSFIVTTNADVYKSRLLVNSAGLYSDKVSAMAGDNSFKIYPSRGEYLILDTDARKHLSMPVYPVPRQGIGGLGVHLTPSIDGNVLIGPSAEYIDDAEDYSTTSAIQDNLFEEAKILLPSLQKDMIIGAYSGIRSKLVSQACLLKGKQRQSNFGDFIIEESQKVENLINLIGIESPGITASIPIAEKVSDMIQEKLKSGKNNQFKGEYKAGPKFSLLDYNSQNKLIAKNKNYGEVICRCNTITKAEVLQALSNPLKAHTITSVKNRVHTTRGRCQGGYCLTKITDIIMKEYNMQPEDIVYRSPGDLPFPGRVKP